MRRAIKKVKPKRIPKVVAYLMKVKNGKLTPTRGIDPRKWGINPDQLIRAHAASGLREFCCVVK